MTRTVRLETDVEQLVIEEMQRTQRSFDETCNSVLRHALSAPPPRLQPAIELAMPGDLNDELESAEYTRKIRLMEDGLG